ncbi:DUF2484 family protein [Rhodobacter sp. Har01]|uniref:DUF2484 family protein n=1 Tax=Rhodobacter sp. Har01 TaxID=2883999 RepID=UPI001D06B350|nr:DUF2484 family protein [Rhodobacter sp. Har01]MCB6176552.1 DUF2484 family protein [Rhodobacter sp. Har01]
MTPALAAVLWVLGATATAFLPMRRQLVPGLALLLSAPALLLWIGAVHGWLWTLPALLALVSMFRRPFGHLLARLSGRPAGPPANPEDRPK